MTNLLRNGSFEGPATGMTINAVPPDWIMLHGSPDLNYAAWGAGGATDGDDWVWAGSGESIGQFLDVPLVAGTEYKFSVDIDFGQAFLSTIAVFELRDINGVTIGSISGQSDTIIGNYTRQTITFTPSTDVNLRKV